MNKKVVLMILDGWGIGTQDEVSAIAQAKTPFMDQLLKEYPQSKLEASGLAVGLPEGQMGNSEVGHMNIGAGRVVYQDLVKINLALEKHTLAQEKVLVEAFQKAKGKKLHFLGLLSDGGVHSHIQHLKGLCDLAQEVGLDQVFIHAFMDGRDTAPQGGKGYLADLESHIQAGHARVASVIGRYYAMDRDQRWERIKLAYDLLVRGEGKASQDLSKTIQASYDENITDEFIQPIVKVNDQGEAIGKIEPGDVVLFFNFRNDRARQLTRALSQENFPEQDMHKLDLHYVTMTNYDDNFKNVHIIFNKDNLQKTLGEVISEAGKKQIRIAETEKYPHVTFFFSGGREKEFSGEQRILCPSPKVATYDLKPEMSAEEIQVAIQKELKAQTVDFVCLNFANPDMVGHTGVFEAAVKACETVDACTEKVVKTALENEYTCLIIADHGNADIMIKNDHSPHTAHTTNLVPLILVDKEYRPQLKNGKLGDLAPSILHLMGIDIPEEMTGEILVSE